MTSTSIDPRTPVLVGAAQLVQKPDDLTEAAEPLELMVQVTDQAAQDAGASSLAKRAGLIVAIRGFWRYSNPARLVAERLGASGARTGLTHDGGNTPQTLVNLLSARIAAGQLDVAVVVAGEGLWSRRRMKAQGIDRHTTIQEGDGPDEMLGGLLPMSAEAERAQGLEAPVHIYPLFETALRHALGETVDEHRARVARLWERFNRVAVDNPYAWTRTSMTAAEIATPSPRNRMVNYPYTKAQNSNWDLDQAAALILCSAEAATAAGVPRDRWVFPHSGAEGHDTPAVSNRDNLHSSVAIRLAAARALELSGHTTDDLAFVDLYACFPSAVQIAAREIGLDQSRPLTVTGGNTFAGGPVNSYVSHAIATMTGLLRNEPEAVGLVTGNGGYLTKHAIGVYAAHPPAAGFRLDDVQAKIDEAPTRQVATDYEGPATVEAYTVMHEHEGPVRGLIAILLPDGRRAWGRSTDTGTMDELMARDVVGDRVHRRSDGVIDLDGLAPE